MPRSPIFLAALIAGISYFFSDGVTTQGPLHLAWKGAGVGLLAVWAASRARSPDGWLLALAMAVYAVADVVIELAGMFLGGATFAAGHAVVIALLLRNRRSGAGEDWMIAALLLVAVPLAAFVLPERRADGVQVALYAAILGAMAVCALLSNFRRDRVLLGAMLFVMSDLLIFSRLGALRGSVIPDLGVWPLYFAGQALMAVGVVEGLERRGR